MTDVTGRFDVSAYRIAGQSAKNMCFCMAEGEMDVRPFGKIRFPVGRLLYLGETRAVSYAESISEQGVDRRRSAGFTIWHTIDSHHWASLNVY